MASASPACLSLTLAVAAGVTISAIAGTTLAQPNSDVYAYPDIELAVALATGPVTVGRGHHQAAEARVILTGIAAGN
jgi:hypothetical protein